MENTKITCPVCGAEFAISEHTHVSVGIAIGKDAGLGEIHPELAKKPEKSGEKKPVNKAAERLQALKDAGVDVTNLFAMQGASGDGMLARMSNGTLLVVPDDDPIFNAIKKGGTVPERRLFRRWVVSQMFHMLTRCDYGKTVPMGFTKALRCKGYEYQFKMMQDELDVQAKLSKSDSENFLERNLWFDKSVACDMASDYVVKLGKYITSLTVKKCKGKEYVHIEGSNIFVKDLEAKVIAPLHDAHNCIIKAWSPAALSLAFAMFNRVRVRLPFDTSQCTEWVSAYKGAGAYYTMKNLILFHGCRIEGNDTAEKSLAALDGMAAEFSKNGEGWKLFGFMKKFLDDNHIDIKAKMEEWKKAR